MSLYHPVRVTVMFGSLPLSGRYYFHGPYERAQRTAPLSAWLLTYEQGCWDTVNHARLHRQAHMRGSTARQAIGVREGSTAH